jgi:hypothetical protein
MQFFVWRSLASWVTAVLRPKTGQDKRKDHEEPNDGDDDALDSSATRLTGFAFRLLRRHGSILFCVSGGQGRCHENEAFPTSPV